MISPEYLDIVARHAAYAWLAFDEGESPGHFARPYMDRSTHWYCEMPLCRSLIQLHPPVGFHHQYVRVSVEDQCSRLDHLHHHLYACETHYLDIFFFQFIDWAQRNYYPGQKVARALETYPQLVIPVWQNFSVLYAPKDHPIFTRFGVKYLEVNSGAQRHPSYAYSLR